MDGEFLKALRQGVPQAGLVVMYPAPGIVERIGADWDWIWVDGQHGQFGYNDILGMVRACDLTGKPAFVRVPGSDFGAISLALDTGAAGIIVPLIESADEARRIVMAAKFPPLGSRSFGGRRPIDRHGRLYSDTANNDVLLVAQIESPSAVARADEIAAVPGIDALFLGPDDLMLRSSCGITAARNRETLGGHMEAVVAACRHHGKFSCMVGASKEMFDLCVELGFNLIVAGGDVSFLAAGSRAAADMARSILQKRPATMGMRGDTSPY